MRSAAASAVKRKLSPTTQSHAARALFRSYTNIARYQTALTRLLQHCRRFLILTPNLNLGRSLRLRQARSLERRNRTPPTRRCYTRGTPEPGSDEEKASEQMLYASSQLKCSHMRLYPLLHLRQFAMGRPRRTGTAN